MNIDVTDEMNEFWNNYIKSIQDILIKLKEELKEIDGKIQRSEHAIEIAKGFIR